MNACPVALSEYRHNSGRDDAMPAYLAQLLERNHDAYAWEDILVEDNGRLASALIALCVRKGLAQDVADLLAKHAFGTAMQMCEDDA